MDVVNIIKEEIRLHNEIINILLELMIKKDNKEIEKLYDKIYERKEELYTILKEFQIIDPQ